MADTGRDLVMTIDGTAIAGAQENGVSTDGSPVDITDKGDGGWRTLADFAGMQSVDISVSGVWTDDVLRAAALGGTSLLLATAELEYADGATLAAAGGFYLASYEETGAHDGAVTFTASLQSSGAVTYTAAP